MNKHIAKKLINKFSKNIKCDIYCDDGWASILDDAIRSIVTIDPDITIQCIKEKFGHLRIYCSMSDGLTSQKKDRINAILSTLESHSASVCELCGSNNAKIRKMNNRVMKALCDDCKE